MIRHLFSWFRPVSADSNGCSVSWPFADGLNLQRSGHVSWTVVPGSGSKVCLWAWQVPHVQGTGHVFYSLPRSSKEQELLVNPYIVFYFFCTLIPKVDVLVDISKHRSWTFCPQLQPWIFCHSPTPRIDFKIWSWKTPGVSNALPQNRSRTPIRMVMCTHTHEQCSNLPAKKGRMLKFFRFVSIMS